MMPPGNMQPISLEFHKAENYLSLVDGYDEYDRMLPREGLTSDDPLVIALDFWGSWTDTAEHTWRFYPGRDLLFDNSRMSDLEFGEIRRAFWRMQEESRAESKVGLLVALPT